MVAKVIREGAIDSIERARSVLRLSEQHAQLEAQGSMMQKSIQSLSEHERQVLDWLVAGMANNVIAFDLGISPRMVEVYQANDMTKMQAGSLSELLRMALRPVAGPDVQGRALKENTGIGL